MTDKRGIRLFLGFAALLSDHEGISSCTPMFGRNLNATYIFCEQLTNTVYIIVPSLEMNDGRPNKFNMVVNCDDVPIRNHDMTYCAGNGKSIPYAINHYVAYLCSIIGGESCCEHDIKQDHLWTLKITVPLQAQ